jgi:hypothetical protein
MLTTNEIEHLVHHFEAATLPMADFHHREHLMVALWYAANYEPDEALSRVRAGLLRLLAVNGKSAAAYREDVTALWMQRAHEYLRFTNSSALPEMMQQWLLHAADYPASSPRPTAAL